MGISVKGTIVGAEQASTWLTGYGTATAIGRMREAVRQLGYTLEANVKARFLNGESLNRRSGRLARSINTKFTSSGTQETARVGTSVSYGRIWELTGSRAYTILPKNKKALFWKGAAHPVRSVFHPAQKPRPFLKPALDELRPTIHNVIALAMRKA